MGFIYLATNKVNGKRYVGKTKETIQKRWERHIYDAFVRGCDFYFHRAMRKYGLENFTVEQVIECPNNELNNWERYYIRYYDTYYLYEKGYNLTWGGDGGQKIDDDKVIQYWNQGYSTTEIAKILNFHPVTILNALKRNKIDVDEIRHRSKSHAALSLCKQVYQYDYEGNLINIYKNLSDMYEKTGYSKDYIGTVCNHRAATANGYLWKYEDDDTPIEELIKNIPPELNHPVLQYSLDGTLLKEYYSFSEAERRNNLSKGFLGKVTKNLGKTAGGYFWIEKNSNITIEDHLKAKAEQYQDREAPVFQYTKDGKFIKQYRSIAEASRETGIEKTNIQKSSLEGAYLAGGYIWLREDNPKLVEEIVKRHNKLTIPVEQYDLDGNYIATYPSARAAAKALGQENKFHNIYSVIQGRQKTSLGFKWKYQQ